MTDIFKKLESQIRPGGFHSNIGMHRTAYGEDWVEMGLELEDRFLIDEERKLPSSGIIFSLVDAAMGGALIARMKKLQPMATLDLRTDYLRAPASSKIFARATCYKVARHVAFLSCTAHEGDLDDPIARSLGTFALLDNA